MTEDVQTFESTSAPTAIIENSGHNDTIASNLRGDGKGDDNLVESTVSGGDEMPVVDETKAVEQDVNEVKSTNIVQNKSEEIIQSNDMEEETHVTIHGNNDEDILEINVTKDENTLQDVENGENIPVENSKENEVGEVKGVPEVESDRIETIAESKTQTTTTDVSEEESKEPNVEEQNSSQMELADAKKTTESETCENPTPSSKKKKKASPSFVYDPEKITIKFIFANRDGISVIVDCTPSSTVAEVKGALLTMWPKELGDCSETERLRLICMGKGILSPDNYTLEQCNVPSFKTHATPINVSVRPSNVRSSDSLKKKKAPGDESGSNSVSTGCSCVIL